MIEILFSLFTLVLLEIILGIDNLVFIAIFSSRLPLSQQKLARRLGLGLALITRLWLLAFAVKIIGLTKPLFTLFSLTFSGRDLFFLFGGLFLLIKGTQEIHTEIDKKVKRKYEERKTAKTKLITTVFQISLFDIIFSLDSILTAVGLTQRFWVMAFAILIAIAMMFFVSEPLTRFINQYPSVKMLALSFLLLIGTTLIADAFHFELPRSYIYFSVCFSLFVEMLNILLAQKHRAAG